MTLATTLAEDEITEFGIEAKGKIVTREDRKKEQTISTENSTMK
jgi:hypothetical protein